MPVSRQLVDIHKHPPPWRRWPETEAVLEALTVGGGSARFVGGCVRDSLLGVKTEDIDIATNLLPESVVTHLERAGITAIPTGIDHGTVTAVIGKKHFEITTLRVDTKSHGRHADVAFTGDWEQDAKRRDFTFNALYLDPTGELVDPVGGLADLTAGYVRFIGSAEERINEDRLRVLRYFRFYARFGADNPDEDALKACANSANELGNLSAERVQKELLLLLATEDPYPALFLMSKAGVLEALVGPADLLKLKLLLSLNVESDALQRFTVLLKGNHKSLQALADKLRFSNKQKDRISVMCEGRVAADMSPEAREVALYELGSLGFIDQTVMLWVNLGSQHDLTDYLEDAAKWTAPVLPVNGGDLLAHGMGEGEALGRLLNQMEARWIDSGFTLSKSELIREFLSDT
ncbi:CCA tRNA nucleotidyltransferase [uncultured Sneathiella sp.]|uniref:CCA tRNA nucleotidyltransferase n=1 Tax=uncultured Sneathiella sp. TaxID=879315 RepID=UPI0030EDA01D|tara:strand:- start:17357 stop:18574 length:1218 start_codon:yes stop_codon:yes gene_type:complete